MIRRLAVRALSTPPVLTFLRRRALVSDPLTILCYHTLGPDQNGVDGWTIRRESDLRADLANIARHYDIVSLDAALSNSMGGNKRPRAVLTFDDGDRGLAQYLGAVLNETGHPATIYVATSQIETGQPFWFDRVVNALQDVRDVRVDGLGQWLLPEAPGKARWAVLREILAALKAVPPEDRDDLADRVVAAGTLARTPGLGPMARADLSALAALPEITIGAHSHGHELLDQIPPDVARASVARSRDLLRDWTGQEVRHFAFPNGNYTPALCEMVRDLGFASAAILKERLAPRGADPFALPRISVGRYDTPARVQLKLVGI